MVDQFKGSFTGLDYTVDAARSRSPDWCADSAIRLRRVYAHALAAILAALKSSPNLSTAFAASMSIANSSSGATRPSLVLEFAMVSNAPKRSGSISRKDPDGSIDNWSAEPMPVIGEDVETLGEELERFRHALSKPVLDYEAPESSVPERPGADT